MTPIAVSGSVDEHSANYTGEAKTECLVLCSGLGALHNHKTSINCVKSPRTEIRPPLATNRLEVLRNSERTRNKRKGFLQKPSLPLELSFSNLKNTTTSIPSLPRMVKVSVYTKAVNPYIVIYDSNKKYSKPAAYLKLMNCIVKSGGQVSKDSETNNNNEEDDCLFRIFPCKHEDIDNAGIITLRASTPEKREEWVQFLRAVSSGKGTNSESDTYIPGSSVLPTLIEQEDNVTEEDSNSSTDSLKSPSRRKNREGRRSSLNSLGVRLRCYSIGKERI